MWAFESVSLVGSSEIRVSYEVAVLEDVNCILRIIYNGKYRSGSAGRPDATYMRATAAAGVAAFDPDAVIFDFSKFSYTWGDELDTVYDTAARYALLVGPHCREAIRTLELGQFSIEPLSSIPWVHETLDAACEYLQRELRGRR